MIDTMSVMSLPESLLSQIILYTLRLEEGKPGAGRHLRLVDRQ